MPAHEQCAHAHDRERERVPGHELTIGQMNPEGALSPSRKSAPDEVLLEQVNDVREGKQPHRAKRAAFKAVQTRARSRVIARKQ